MWNKLKGEFYQGHMQIAVNFVHKKEEEKPFRCFFCYIYILFYFFFWGGGEGGLVFYFHKTIVRNKALSCIWIHEIDNAFSFMQLY